MRKSASLLDRQRLGKQRVEAIQIARILVGITPDSRWRNHPAVKMWQGYEAYLVWEYLVSHVVEWAKRGYKNTKCLKHLAKLGVATLDQLPASKPPWIDCDFIESHRSNLIAKNEMLYGMLFPNTKRGLEYLWPVK